MFKNKFGDRYEILRQTIKIAIISQHFDIIVYTFLFVSTIFINKYVLSVLKFTYPTVFQGWQTLVGVIILKVLHMMNKLEVAALDKNMILNLLPHCIFFLGAIISGSKALAVLPIPIVVCVWSLCPACIFLLDYSATPSVDIGLVTVTAGILSLGTAVSVVLLDIRLPFAESGYSYLLAYVVFVTAQVLQSRITNPRHTEVDKLYYSNMFSVVVLAPSSFYLEEAFSVLQFQHRRQLRFYLGCLLSGVLGVLLQLWVARSRPQKWFCRTQCVARLLTCLLSGPVFGTADVKSTVWLFATINLVSTAYIPPESDFIVKNNEALVV